MGFNQEKSTTVRKSIESSYPEECDLWFADFIIADEQKAGLTLQQVGFKLDSLGVS